MTLTVFKVTVHVRQPGAIGVFSPYNLEVAAQEAVIAKRVAAHALIDLGWETNGTEARPTSRTYESQGARSLLLECPDAPPRAP